MTTDWRLDQRNRADGPGLARVLNMSLIACLASSLAITTITFSLGWRLTPYLSFLAAASCSAALVLSRSGWPKQGVFLALAGIAFAVMFGAAKNDGMQSVGLASVPVVIIIASLLLDNLTCALFSAGALLATASMLFVRYCVLRLETYSTADAGDFLIFAAICATAAVVGRLLSSRVHEDFRRVRASEGRYRRVYENIHDVYYEMLPDGTVLELSPSATSLFGVPREEIIGHSLAPFFANQSDFDALLNPGFRGRRVSNRELVIRSGDGALIHILVNASFQNGHETGEQRIVGSMHDITDLTLAEQELRESESRLRLALEATGAGTFDFCPQTDRLICSDIARLHFGVSPDGEMTTDLFLSAVHPDDRERVRQEVVSVAGPNRGRPLATEYRTLGLEDDKERWIAVRGRMLFDAEDRAVRLIGTTVDISARKHLEQELSQRIEELETIMDVAPVALFATRDPGCSQVIVNRTAKAMLEINDSAISLSAPAGPTPPCPFFRDGVEIPPDQLPLQTAARGVPVHDSELEVLLPGGSTRVLCASASPLRDPDGRVRGAIAAVQDVTESRQRSQALLRESEERFQRAADAAPVIIWFSDAEKRLTFVNEQFIKFTGVPAEQLLGHGWIEIIHPDDLDAIRAAYYDGMESRATYQLEYRILRADGEYRHMLGTTTPGYVGMKYAGQVGSVVDITDLKQRQRDDFARQKWESVGMLASGIAHDFNNLLASVLAESELALEEFAEGNSPEDELKRIGDVARRGSEIVRELMIYSGKETDPSEMVDLSRTVQEMLELLRMSISKHAALQTDLCVDLPPVHADAAQIRQIVMNLVTNASEAIGDHDGVINVTTRPVVIARDDLNANGSDLDSRQYLELQVRDTGCGISVETQSKMFDPFFSTKAAGRGLGLAVVQGIVRALHGTIEFSSEPGRGATFRILLPCAKASLSAIHPVRRAETVSGSVRPPTILIVEDEHALRQSVAKMLRNKGFSVIEAADGSAALGEIGAPDSCLDVVLLDITLPGASSSTVLNETKLRLPEIKVIATSAYDEDAALASLQGRPDGFIRKPYRVAELVDLLLQVLARPN